MGTVGKACPTFPDFTSPHPSLTSPHPSLTSPHPSLSSPHPTPPCPHPTPPLPDLTPPHPSLSSPHPTPPCPHPTPSCPHPTPPCPDPTPPCPHPTPPLPTRAELADLIILVSDVTAVVEVLDREGSEGLAEGLLGYAVPWSAGLVVALQGGGPRLLNMVWWSAATHIHSCVYASAVVRKQDY